MSDTPTNACYNEATGTWDVVSLIETSRTLEREVAALTAEVGEFRQWQQRATALLLEQSALRARLTELEQDKGRLDWLSVAPHVRLPAIETSIGHTFGDPALSPLSQAIDSARESTTDKK